MRKYVAAMTIAATAAFAVPSVASADCEMCPADKKAKQGQVQSDLSQRRLGGQLESYRTAQIRGQQEPHVLAKIRTDQGQTVVADLGPISNLQRQNVQLRRGQRIDAAGRQGRINDLPVLIVDRFAGDNQFTVIAFEPMSRQRDAQRQQQASRQQQQRGTQQFGFDQQQQQFGQQQYDRQRQQRSDQQRQRFEQGQQRFDQQRQFTPQQRQHIERMRGADRDRRADQLNRVTIQGRLVDLRGVELAGVPDSHRLAKLQTRDGRTIVVDLGTGDELRDIKLQRNEMVTVVGTMGRINNRPVVFADLVADVAVIDRTQEQRARNGQQFQQQRQQQQRQQR